MSAGHTVTIHPGSNHVEVRVGGEVLASSDRPMLLEETGLPTRYYLSPQDVRTERLRPTSFHTTCPFKGEASYWSVEVDGEVHDGVVWAYEDPIEGAADIRGLFSFYPGRAEIVVDGEPVTS